MSDWSSFDIAAIAVFAFAIGYFVGMKVTQMLMIIKMMTMMTERGRHHTSGLDQMRSQLDTMTEENAVDVLTDIGDRIGMKVLKAVTHGPADAHTWYLYDLKDNFVCQGRDAATVAANFWAVSPPGMNAVVLDSNDRVQWRFEDGKIHEGPVNEH